MSRSRLAALPVLALTAITLLALPAQAAPTTLSASLTGATEVPGPGDPDGAGSASVAIDVKHSELCFTLHVRDIQPAAAAHIHEAPVGVAGPIVVTLTPPPTSGDSTGCVHVARGELREIVAHPEDYYVNVHNAEFPAGAVRGQLS